MTNQLSREETIAEELKWKRTIHDVKIKNGIIDLLCVILVLIMFIAAMGISQAASLEGEMKIICPVSDGFTPENPHDRVMYADILDYNAEKEKLLLQCFSREIFSFEDISTLKVGDVIVSQGAELTVTDMDDYDPNVWDTTITVTEPGGEQEDLWLFRETFHAGEDGEEDIFEGGYFHLRQEEPVMITYDPHEYSLAEAFVFEDDEEDRSAEEFVLELQKNPDDFKLAYVIVEFDYVGNIARIRR